MTPRVLVADMLYLQGFPRSVEVELQRACEFMNPKWARLEKLGRWNGHLDPKIALWEAEGEWLILPRGVGAILKRLLREHHIEPEVEDKTVSPRWPDLPLKPKLTLYDYQERALNELLSKRQGVLVAPTGSGKGSMIFEAIARLKTPAMVLVHTKELKDQAVQRCRDWLDYDPGVIGAGKAELRDVTVGMIPTLVRRDLSEIVDRFGIVFTDECGHVPARTWLRVISQFPARYRYGCSATPWRKDRMQGLLYRAIGDVVATVSPEEVRAAGKIVKPEVEIVESDFYYPISDSEEWTQMLGELVKDPERNQIVANVTRERVVRGDRVLVLSDRVVHVETLSEMLADLDPVTMTGEMKKRDREAAMEKVRNGAKLTLATSQLLGEGIDEKTWTTLVLASPFSGGPRVLQAVGRVVRAAPGKRRATVIDIHDPQVPILVNAARKRAVLYAGESTASLLG